MKVLGLFTRGLSILVPVFCTLILFSAPLAHAQQFTFSDFSSTTGLTLNGNAATASGSSGTVLRLTPGISNQNGNAWYTNQLPLKAGFTSTFAFQFTGQGGDGGHADGIAFVIQGVGTGAGGYLGGAMGYGDDDANSQHSLGITNSVAIEFDTYWNNWDSNNNHIAVMSCGSANNSQHHGVGGCASGADPTIAINNNLSANLTDGAVHTVIVTYQPPCDGCQNLTVQLDGTQVIATAFDLASLGLDANDDAFVGFTGATGGGFENQDILSWNFGVTVVQTFQTDVPTISNFSNSGNENTQTLDLSKATDLKCHDAQNNEIPCPTTTLATTNTTIPSGSTWPQYVGGTPWATSVCAARPSNGGTGDLCSLFVNSCFGGTVSQSQASDFYCPFAIPDVQNNSIIIKDTWDPLDPKPDIAPGTTVSLIDFVPTTPDETWTASPLGTTNPVCTNVFASGFHCDIADSLTDMFGDQTTTRGSKPKKGWIVTVFNVPMLTTTWSVGGGAGCPKPLTQLNTPPANIPSTAWFNGACLVQFTVNPAAPQNPSNNFVAAPPASITYGAGAAHVPPLGDQSQTNASLQSPWTFSTGTLSALINLINGGGSGDGTYVLHWSAVDNVGISEKHIQLIPQGSDTSCYNPENEEGLVPPCYNTDLFTTNLNVDSTAPAVNCPAPDTSHWYNNEVVVSCTASDATSGIGSANPVVAGVPSVGGAQVAFTVQTNVGSGNYDANASTNLQKLFDLALNETDASFSGLKIDRAFPTISAITLSPSGTYTIGQNVKATFTCADLGSGLVAPCTGTGGVKSGQYIDTSSSGTKTFTVTATDVAGNVTTRSVNYTVNAPAADVALFEQPGSVKRGTNLNAIFWALDLSTNSASNVVINATLSAPAGVVGGSISAQAGIVSCNLLTGCRDLPPASGANCTVTSSTSVSCNIGTLPTVLKITGAVVKLVIPVSSSASAGQKITVTGVVSSANDSNSKNNTASQTFTVSR